MAWSEVASASKSSIQAITSQVGRLPMMRGAQLEPVPRTPAMDGGRVTERMASVSTPVVQYDSATATLDR